MTDAQTIDRLRECVQRERRSLLHYAADVPLWTTPADQAARERVRTIAHREAAAIDDLAQHLERTHAVRVHLGPFPSRFTSFNDVAFGSLLPVIVETHRRNLAALEADFAAADSQGHSILEPLVNLKREHAAELERLAAAGGHAH